MTLGQLLKNKRLELGKSIEQIATATRIHSKVLRALEEDQYGELPARAFTRGFIISYCKALQINSDTVLRDYHDFLESKYSERPEKDHGHHGYAFEGKETEQNKRWMIISASGAAFFAVITLLFFKPQNHKHKEKHKELISEEAEMSAAAMSPTATPSFIVSTTASTTSTAVAEIAAVIPPKKMEDAETEADSETEADTDADEVKPTASSTPNATSTPQEDPLNKGDGILPKDAKIKIVILATEDTLIHYHSDQRKPFSIMLRKGKQLVIKGTELVKIQTSTPKNLKYRVNFKNKASADYSELKSQHLELRPDGTETPSDATAL